LENKLCADIQPPINEESKLDYIIEIVTGKLATQIPIPSFMYDSLIKSKINDIQSNFRIFISSEDRNKFWPIIATLISGCFTFNYTSEFSNIKIFDMHIATVLELLLPESRTVRNISLAQNIFTYGSSCVASRSSHFSDALASIKSDNLIMRPYYSLFIQEFLFFVGEEKVNPSDRQKALDQLLKLFGKSKSMPTMLIGNIPFLFGYVTYGHNIELFCFDRKKKAHSINVFDLKLPEDSLRLFTCIVNIARVLKAYVRMFKNRNTGFNTLQFNQETKRNKATVTVYPGGVVKRYPKLANEDAERIYKIYSHLNDRNQYYKNAIVCLHLPRPKTIRENEESEPIAVFSMPFELAFSPLCAEVTSDRLSTVKEIVKALICVLKVLVPLHDNEFVHGDVRWTNVMYDIDEKNYILIDFDNGGKKPLRITKRNKLKGYPLKDMVTGK
jgi:hypothetical protein